MHPVLIDFGLFKLHTYGLMIAMAFMVGMQLGAVQAEALDVKRTNYREFILDLCFGCLIWSMVGSRVLFIIVNWSSEYAHDPMKIIRIWEGGLVYYGGFIGAVIWSIYYCRKKARNFFEVADILIPLVALGQFFGRIGCFAAGCCWGRTADSSFPFAVQFPAGSLIMSSMVRHNLVRAGAEYSLHVHPVQLYESAGTLVLFFLLILIRSRKRFHGQALLSYLFLYPILRSSLEFLRGDKERGYFNIFGDVYMSTAQLISMGIAAVAVVLLVVLARRFPNSDPPAPLAAGPS